MSFVFYLSCFHVLVAIPFKMWPGIYLMEILDELPILTAAQHHAAPIFGNYGLRSPRRDVPRNCSGGCTMPTIFPLINDDNVELRAVQR